MKDLAIPNSINLALAGAFLIFAALIPLPPGGLKEHLLFGVGMLIVGVVGFSMGWLGGGAAKFNAAVALWLGPSGQYAAFVMVSLLVSYALWRVAARVGQDNHGMPVNLVGAPTFALLFLTTPMWAALVGGWPHVA